MLFSDESVFELIPSRRAFVRRTGERFNQDGLEAAYIRQAHLQHPQGWWGEALRPRFHLSTRWGFLSYSQKHKSMVWEKGYHCEPMAITESWSESNWTPLGDNKAKIRKKAMQKCWWTEEAIFETWECVTSTTTENLVYSMPQRCASVIATQGGSTKY